MKRASAQAYLPISKLRALRAKMLSGPSPAMAMATPGAVLEDRKEAEELAANVFSISLGSLSEHKGYATGDATYCGNCKAVFSVHSKSHIGQEADGTYWTCEFCGAKTKLTLDPHEYPSSDTSTYILEAAAKPVVEDTKGGEGITAIFCIDASGSMNKRKRLGGFSAKTRYMSKANEVSRLEALKMVIDTQIQKLAQEDPRAKVGFVTFANDVGLIGDGSQAPYIIPREHLNNFFGLIEATGNVHDQYMSQTIASAQHALLTKLAAIRTGGDTALGPALVVGMALASKGAVGSKVIICTDGLANRGLGEIKTNTVEEAEGTKRFYTQVGEYAQQHGIMLSVISLVESECRLDLLSPIANLTAGDIMRIDPMRPSTNFAGCLSEKVVATGVSVRIKLHRALEFVRVPNSALSPDHTLYTQQVGNVTRDSCITFEYALKAPAALAALGDLQLETQSVFPFQAQIVFKEPSGKKCLRVITQTQGFTEKLEEANKEVSADIIKAHAIRTTAMMAESGALHEATANMRRWGNLAPDAKRRAVYDRETASLSKAINMQMKMPTGKGAAQIDALTIALNSAQQQRLRPVPEFSEETSAYPGPVPMSATSGKRHSPLQVQQSKTKKQHQ
jgi:hypothetical protein